MVESSTQEKAKEEDDLSALEEEEDPDQVLEKLKAQIESDKEGSIAARVRQRHIEDDDEEEKEE